MDTSRTILLVEDDPATRAAITAYFRGKGIESIEADGVASAVAKFRSRRPDCTILDFHLPDGTAIDLIPRLLEIDSEAALIVLTGHGTIDLAVTTIKLGAEHFLTKPVELATLELVVDRVIEDRRGRKERLASRRSIQPNRVDPFLGRSPAIEEIRRDAAKLAKSDRPVLVVGETGTGKGVLARWLHENGPRREEAFVDINSAGLRGDLLENELFGHEKGAFTGAQATKPGLFEIADRGTFFLDEIGDVDHSVQPKLLKVLEERTFRRLGDVRDRRVDVRLIAATHHDLAARVQEGKFREDLYFRLNALTLVVPPLRDRRDDIPGLVELLATNIAVELHRPPIQFSPAAMERITAYDWPGNIRELRNLIDRQTLLNESGIVEEADLRLDGTRKMQGDDYDTRLTLAELEKVHVRKVFSEEGGRVDLTARRLGVSRSMLYERLKQLGLRN